MGLWNPAASRGGTYTWCSYTNCGAGCASYSDAAGGAYPRAPAGWAAAEEAFGGASSSI